MDYEEYKRKALEPIVNYIESVMTSYSKEELEARIKKALPEKESEDERITNCIGELLRKAPQSYFVDMGTTFVECFAYLEKQKEQKPVDLVAELRHHLATTPKEQLKKEWKELEPWGNVGPTVKEFLYGKQVAEESDAESDYGIDEDYIPATLFHALKKHGWYACHCKEGPEIIDARRAYVIRNWNVGNENLPQDHKPLSSEETELNSIAFLEQIGYTCIPPGKEQKPEIKDVYPIFRVGDTIKPKVYNESHRINKIKDDNYVLDNGFTFPIVDQDVWEIVEQPAEWSEDDIDKMVNARSRKSGTTKSEMEFYRQGIKDTLKSLQPH